MDDGPRTGALQLLILAIAAPAALTALSIATSHGLLPALIPATIALLGLYAILRLEVYARHRAHEERELRERRLRDAHMPHDPFG